MPPICLVTKTKLQWGACKAVKKSHSPKRTSFNGDQTIFPPVHNVQNKLLHSTYATPPKTPKLAVNTTRFLKRNRNHSVSFRAIISNNGKGHLAGSEFNHRNRAFLQCGGALPLAGVWSIEAHRRP